MQISGATVALMYLLRWSGIPLRWAPVVVALVSALGIFTWIYAHGTLNRADTFSCIAA